MNIKNLGLEELSVSEVKQTNGGIAPLVIAGIIVLVCFAGGCTYGLYESYEETHK